MGCKLLILLHLILLGGCFRVDVINDSKELFLSSGPKEQWNHIYLLGLVNYSPYLLIDDLCRAPHQWYRIRMERSIDNYIASLFSLHVLWTPTQVQVQCGRAPLGGTSGTLPPPYKS